MKKFLSTLDITHMDQALFTNFQWTCEFKGHTLELLYTHEYTQGENEASCMQFHLGWIVMWCISLYCIAAGLSHDVHTKQFLGSY